MAPKFHDTTPKPNAALDDFFAAAKDETPQIDADFLAHLADQAVAEMPPALQARRMFDWGWAKALLNFAPMGGLAAATVAGVVIGINPPDFVLAITTDYFAPETLADMAGDYFLADYIMEES